jgi:hypothetical protein
MIDLVQTKVCQHFLNFQNHSSKSYDFMKEGAFDEKQIFLIVKIRSMTRQIFVLFEVLILYLFTPVKDFADFSYPYCSSTHQTLSL